ncbi:MAG: ribonuclease D [Myxococcota bacterium]|jgi:ribonuclease D
MAGNGNRTYRGLGNGPDDVELITSDAQLIDLCDAAALAGRVGLDTEFIRDRTYYSQLALLQVSVDERFAIVDPEAGLDLKPVDELMLDPTIRKVLHAASQDLDIFYQRSKQIPVNVFDTQIAASMCGFGFQIGYTGAVVQTLGVELSKGEQYSDWLRRPLTDKQLSYAADDVRYLLPLMDALLQRIEELDRVEPLEQELLRLTEPTLYAPTAEHLAARVKGTGSVNGKHRAALLRLVAWRESEAQKRDIPRKWILADAPLAGIAKAMPQDVRELSRIRGLNRGDLEKRGRAIVREIELSYDDPIPPSRKSGGRPASPAAPILKALLEALCESQSLALAVVASSATVEALAASHAAGTLEEDGSPILEGWRGALFGRPLIEFLEGRSAVHVDQTTGALALSPR